MTNNSDLLLPEEKKNLETQLTNIFGEIESFSDEMEAAKTRGKVAKAKAETVEPGLFKRRKALETLKDVVITNTDIALDTLDVVNVLADNQQKMAKSYRQLLQLGALDLASNRAVVTYIEEVINGGADHTLGEEIVTQLKGVIKDLKQKEDYLIRQNKQGEKIKEHELRLAESEERACGQEKQLYDLHQKDIEQDERLVQGEEKDIEQDAILEGQRQRESEYEEIIAGLELRVKNLEKSQNSVSAKRTMLYWAISISIGLIGVLLGIIALLK